VISGVYMNLGLGECCLLALSEPKNKKNGKSKKSEICGRRSPGGGKH
jgi:hypothetical protein